MGFLTYLFRYLFDKNARFDHKVRNAMWQAINVANSYLTDNEKGSLVAYIDTLQDEWKATAPAQTTEHVEAQFMALAQKIALYVWENFGQRLSQEECTELSQSIVTQQVYNEYPQTPPGSTLAKWLGRAILERVWAFQASAPIALCFEGHEAEAKDICDRFMDISKLKGTKERAEAMQALSDAASFPLPGMKD